MSTYFIEYGRFIESFDTVRHGEEDENRKEHAEIELMLSLLFGEPMVVSEPQSFDSDYYTPQLCCDWDRSK